MLFYDLIGYNGVIGFFCGKICLFRFFYFLCLIVFENRVFISVVILDLLIDFLKLFKLKLYYLKVLFGCKEESKYALLRIVLSVYLVSKIINKKK